MKDKMKGGKKGGPAKGRGNNSRYESIQSRGREERNKAGCKMPPYEMKHAISKRGCQKKKGNQTGRLSIKHNRKNLKKEPWAEAGVLSGQRGANKKKQIDLRRKLEKGHPGPLEIKEGGGGPGRLFAQSNWERRGKTYP